MAESKVEVWVDIDEAFDNLERSDKEDFISQHLDEADVDLLMDEVKKNWSTIDILCELPFDEIADWVDTIRESTR